MGSMNFCIPEYLIVGQLLPHDPCMRAYTFYDENDYAAPFACKSRPNPAPRRSPPAKPRSPSQLGAACNLCPIEEEEEAVAVTEAEEDPGKAFSPSAAAAAPTASPCTASVASRPSVAASPAVVAEQA